MLDSQTTYVLHDRSDPRREFIYVIRREGIAARSTIFPGYTDARFYEERSDQLSRMVRAEHLMSKYVKFGRVMMGGPWYFGNKVPKGQRLKDTDLIVLNPGASEVEQFYNSLRQEIVTKELQVASSDAQFDP